MGGKGTGQVCAGDIVPGRKRNPGIDWMKLFAAWMVVAIHTYPFAGISEPAEILITRTLCRLAVPFFFLVTGFYVIPRCLEGGRGGRAAFVWFRKTAVLYGAAVLIYLPVNLYAGRLSGDFSARQALKEVLWNGTFYHLWYLPAVLLGMALTLLLIRLLGKKGALAVSLVLYAAGLLGDSYYGLTVLAPPLRHFYEGLWNWMDYTRNGIFFAPAFLCLGACLKDWSPPSARACRIGTAVFTGLLLLEGWIVHAWNLPRHDSMYFMLVPAAAFLFVWARTWRVPSAPGGENLPMLIYLLHPACIIGIRGVAGILRLNWLLVENSLIHFAAVAVSAAAVSAVLLHIWKKGVELRNERAR